MILHLLKKDTRRLWPHVAVTLLLLALLAREDGWRADWVPSPTEGWLNLLLPLAWACLVALAVEQEPLTGDQQFWLTRPYRRPALFAAKALFVVLFIHIPSFIADCYILSAREFSALVYLPQLLWKQVLLGAALTLPALALAAMSRSFAHFMLAVFAIAAAIAFLTGGFPNPPLPWQAVDNVRHAVIVAVIAAAAGGITLLQFTRRRTGAARVIGIASALAAGTMSAYMPVTYTFALRSAMQPGPAQAVLRLVPPEERSSVPAPLWSGSEMITAALPVAISGIPHSAQYRVEQLEVEIVGPHGERYRTPKRSSYRPFDKVMLDTYMWSPKSEDRSPSWLILRINRSVHEQIRDDAVKIAGKAAITFYRLGAPAWMNAAGGVSVLAAGQCSSHLVEGRWSEAMLKVECESPTPIPLFTRVRLWHPETGKEWKQRLGDSAPHLLGPHGVWLSPLHRRQTFFRLTERPSQAPGAQWLVPRDAIQTARVEIIPELDTGYSTFQYELTDITLREFVVQGPGR